jgi:hypothetical protein
MLVEDMMVRPCVSLKDAILGLSPDGETAFPMRGVNEGSGRLSTAPVQAGRRSMRLTAIALLLRRSPCMLNVTMFTESHVSDDASL